MTLIHVCNTSASLVGQLWGWLQRDPLVVNKPTGTLSSPHHVYEISHKDLISILVKTDTFYYYF